MVVTFIIVVLNSSSKLKLIISKHNGMIPRVEPGGKSFSKTRVQSLCD